jgi:hypothetical protein
LFHYRQVFLSLSKCKQYQQNVIPIHVAPTILAICFCNSSSMHPLITFPCNFLILIDAPLYYLANNLFDGCGGEYQSRGTGNLRTMKQYIIREGTRDSFSLSALLPWTLCAFVRPFPYLAFFVIHIIFRVYIHSPSLYASIIHIILLCQQLSHFFRALHRQTLPPRDPK